MTPTIYRHTVNFCEVEADGFTYYFSYDTLVAFEYRGWLTVRENVWSNTTGKHLNTIDNGRKELRVDGDEFNKRLSDTQDMLHTREY